MSEDEHFFQKQLDAVGFLQENGFKISKSKFNRDFNAGLIPCTSDKRFSSVALLTYAEQEVAVPLPAGQRPAIPSKKRGRPRGKQEGMTLELGMGTTLVQRTLHDSLGAEDQGESLIFFDDNGTGCLEPMEADMTSEFRGVCLGIIADGKVVQSEAEFLADWLERHAPSAETNYAICQLRRRVMAMLEDGVFTSREGLELFQLLRRLALPGDEPTHSHKVNAPTKKRSGPPFNPYHCAAPLELISPKADIFDPVNLVDFRQAFCLTGIFAMGDRKDCERQTEQVGGRIVGHPLKNDCYVVVGSAASPDWKHGNYGTKIEKALQYRAEGGSVLIIPEDVWANALAYRSNSNHLLL